jgi:hypothetical protein
VIVNPKMNQILAMMLKGILLMAVLDEEASSIGARNIVARVIARTI